MSIMHKNKSGALISYRGHALTADEFHAAVYGLIGLFIGTSEEITHTIEKEPHYFLGGLALSFIVGKRLRSD